MEATSSSEILVPIWQTTRSLFNPENADSKYLRNIKVYLSNYTEFTQNFFCPEDGASRFPQTLVSIH
jgi:hypothetical protein